MDKKVVTAEELKKLLKPKSNCKMCLGKGVVKMYENVKDDKPKFDYCACFKKRGRMLYDQGVDFGNVTLSINKGILEFEDAKPPTAGISGVTSDNVTTVTSTDESFESSKVSSN